MCTCVFELSDWSLQAKAFGVGDGDGEFVFELLPGTVGRQADLIETCVRDGQPAETHTHRRGNTRMGY